jgi:hypothetical protein
MAAISVKIMDSVDWLFQPHQKVKTRHDRVLVEGIAAVDDDVVPVQQAKNRDWRDPSRRQGRRAIPRPSPRKARASAYARADR